MTEHSTLITRTNALMKNWELGDVDAYKSLVSPDFHMAIPFFGIEAKGFDDVWAVRKFSLGPGRLGMHSVDTHTVTVNGTSATVHAYGHVYINNTGEVLEHIECTIDWEHVNGNWIAKKYFQNVIFMKSPKPTVLVVSATGNVGKQTALELLEKYKDKVHLRVSARDPSKLADLKAHGAEVVTADYADEESLKKAANGAEVVWITAPGVEKREDVTIQALQAIKTVSSVKHVVLLSVQGAEYEAIAFGKSFRKVEKEIEAYPNWSWTFLRAAAFQENVFGSASTIKVGMYFQPLGDKGSFPPVSVADLGKCGANCSVNWKDHKNKAYTLTGPQVLTGAQQAEVVGLAIGKPVKYIDPGNAEFEKSLLANGFPKWQAEGYLELYHVFKTLPSFVSPDLQTLLGKDKPLTLYQTVFNGVAAFK